MDGYAHYAYYGSQIPDRFYEKDVLVLTADGWGDGLNWSISVPQDDGSLSRLACGDNNIVSRLYRFTTLILGMKPLEHEYKVMNLAPYAPLGKSVEEVEVIYDDILRFEDGEFRSRKPLRDNYFDLRERLEGHRFDAIASGLQNWATRVTVDWARHWLRRTGRRVIYFSGGLAMNIKTNAALVRMETVDWVSVPVSGSDESLCAGAAFCQALSSGVVPAFMRHVYLGGNGDNGTWSDRLAETEIRADDFEELTGIDSAALAKLLTRNEIIARCAGRAEFGARALGKQINPGQSEIPQ